MIYLLTAIGLSPGGSTLSLTSGLDWDAWSTPRSGRFIPSEIDPVHILQEARWDAGPVWTDAENLAPTGIRSPYHPARSESLYRLSSLDPKPNRGIYKN